MHQRAYLRRSRVVASTPSDSGNRAALRWAHAAPETLSVVLKLFKRTAIQLLDSHGLAQGHPVLTINVQPHAKATPPGMALWITPTSYPYSATGDHAQAKPYCRSMCLKTLGA